MIHRMVQRRLQGLEHQLPAAYAAQLALCPEDSGIDQMIPLAIDLMRKTHCTDPFDRLSTDEQRIALYAYAIEALPRWQHPFLMVRLRGVDKDLIRTLRQIKTSQPDHPERHFGAIQSEKQLRSARKA